MLCAVPAGTGSSIVLLAWGGPAFPFAGLVARSSPKNTVSLYAGFQIATDLK